MYELGLTFGPFEVSIKTSKWHGSEEASVATAQSGPGKRDLTMNTFKSAKAAGRVFYVT